MSDIWERVRFRVIVTTLYVVNTAALVGIAHVATDVRLDWHDWCYPGAVGAAMLVGIELLAMNWNASRNDPGNATTHGWLWIITVILLLATCATWLWTYNNHSTDLAELERQQSAPPPARFDPALVNSMQRLQQLKQMPGSQP
ncbi:MAG TPA: hypothetical protein VHY37_06220 [Tepidisphaeraceae bacterium]|jgi:uncharacterized BrkB/YihY/UPF0761 family membrane protein|nr:hypothetical protein [Tepidisphaeraceae bacterium]